MDSPTIQADYEQLAAIAGRFAQHAEQSAATRAHLSRQMERLRASWQGNAASTFLSEMDGELLPALGRLVAALEEGVATTREISHVMREAEERAAALFRGDAAPLAPPPPQDGKYRPDTPPGYGTQAWAQTGLLRAAGIDPSSYDPDQPYDYNRAAIEQGYAYYQRLYGENPDYWWMGFAYSAVQNSIYPAFLMLDFMADFLELIEAEGFPLEGVPLSEEMVGWFVDQLFGPNSPPEIVAITEAMLKGEITSADIRAVSQEFVRMQNDIFMDMGAAHWAYNEGGIGLVRQMVRDGKMSEDLGVAFELLDEGRRTGDQTKLAEAARLMADREQTVLIQDNYVTIAEMGEPGRLLLNAMSAMAVPPLPDGQMLREAVPGARIDDRFQRMEWIKGALDVWATMSPEERAAEVSQPLPQDLVEAGIALSEAGLPIVVDRALDVPNVSGLSLSEWLRYWRSVQWRAQ